MKRIRIGNDVKIKWTLKNADGEPYDLDGRDIRIFMEVGAKHLEVTGFGRSENVISFTFYGKDQMFIGKYSIKYIENFGETNMITYDANNIFALVPHTWQEIDSKETYDDISVETVEIDSSLDYTIGKRGPRGYSAYEIAVQQGFVGTEQEWLDSLQANVTRISVINALQTEPTSLEENFILDCGTQEE